MKTTPILMPIFAAVLIAGCSGTPTDGPTAQPTAQATTVQSTTEVVAYAYPEGSVKAGDSALCVICAVNDGATEKEEAHEVITYQGKTYAFCNEAEKAEFISSPAKFAAKE